MTETTNHRFDEATAQEPEGTSTTTIPHTGHSAGTPASGTDSGADARESGHAGFEQPTDSGAGARGSGHIGFEQPTDSKTGGAAEPRFGKFRRRRDGMIAGVCGGAGDLLGIDATLVRVGLVAATVLGFGSGILLYAICWVVVPEE